MEESKEIAPADEMMKSEVKEQQSQAEGEKDDDFEQKYLDKQLVIPPDWKEARLYGQQSHIGRVVAPVGSASNEIETAVLSIRPVGSKSYI